MAQTSSSPAAGGTGSSCSKSIVKEDTVTGSHVLRIECFSATKGLGNGKCISSKPFIVGGHSWVIEFYPDGKNAGKDWTSLFLHTERPSPNPGEDVRARFSFKVIDEEGEPVQGYTFISQETRTFAAGDSDWGYVRFIKRSGGTGSWSFLRDDILNIKCEVTVVKFGVYAPECAKRRRIMVPPSDLRQDLGWLLLSGKGADVVFEVGGELIKAHRNMLAIRSSVFNAELFGPMKEAGTTAAPIKIQDMDAKVFRALLQYMYTETLPAVAEGEEIVMAQHLLVAADRYDLKRLKLKCEDNLSDRIDIGTVATTMVLAEQHACQLLKDSCFEFLVRPGNLKKIKETDGYQHLKTSCPSLMEELVDKFAS